MAQWSDKKAWWLDLLKSVITFTLAAIITVVVINRIEEDRTKQRSYTEACDQLRFTALEDFRKNTLKYSEAALDAYVDLYEWKGPTKTPSMLKYEQEAHDDYLIALEELERRFEDIPGLKEQIATFHRVSEDRHEIYNRLVDTMLETGQYGSDGPRINRKEFDRLREKYRELRVKITRDVGVHVTKDSCK